MTSKISFSKLVKENLRHRLGGCIFTLFCFLGMILLFVIVIQNSMAYDGWTRKEVYQTILDATVTNDVLITVVVILGAFLGISGFSYLHSKKKVDYYHALPITRRELFWVITASSLLIFSIMLVATSLLKIVITTVLGYTTGTFLKHMLMSMFIYWLGFTSSYLVAVLAMIMTGNIIVGIMGTVVFITWIPVIIRYIVPVLSSTFFTSYVKPQHIVSYLDYGSPVFLLYRLLFEGKEQWDYGQKAVVFLAICIWIFLLAMLCQWLFEKRPSESAEKAMVFPSWNPVIRFLLVIPASIYAGFYLYSMAIGSSKLWMFVGIILGVICFHGFIECIFQFDLHGMFASKKQMGAELLIALCIVLTFAFDVYGYDQYVPQKGKIEGIMVQSSNLVNTMDRTAETGEKGVTGMEMEKTLSVLKKALKTKADPQDENTEFLQTTYYMKNGKRIQRNFCVEKENADQILELLFQDQKYKKNLFLLYSKDWNTIEKVSWNNGEEEQDLFLTEEEKNQLFSSYLEEFDTLSYSDIKNTAPTGEMLVQRSTKYLNDPIEEYYFIYPSFQKTLSFLQNKGCEVEPVLTNANIMEIKVLGSDMEQEKEWSVTDPLLIQSVKNKLYISQFNHWIGDSGYDTTTKGNVVIVYYWKGLKEEKIEALIDSETLQLLEQS